MTVVTSAFMGVARAAAMAAGLPSLPMVELPYSILGMSDREAAELADRFLEDIVRELTGQKGPAPVGYLKRERGKA